MAFVCLALWINLFKLASPRWRFEFFTIDFTLGTLLLAAVSAFTLGNLGSGLSFSDRLLVASKTAQALVFLGGGVLGLGALTLFAAVRLIGITAACTLALSLAGLIEVAITLLSGSLFIGGISLALLIAALLAGAKAARGIDSPVPPPRHLRQPAPFVPRRSTKGMLLAIASGLFLGSSLATAFSGMSGDFGLGPYAGLLVLSLGAFLAATPFTLFLLNIKIDLPPGNLRTYFSRQAGPAGSRGQHRYGVLTGIVWGAGTLAYLTERLAPVNAPLAVQNAGIPKAMTDLAAPSAVAVSASLIAILCGVVFWKERKLTKFPSALVGGALLFGCGALLSVLESYL